MFNTTATEAANLLGVSKARVLQLIKSGALSAEKIGNSWLVDSRSVQDRLSAKPQAGRPAQHSRADSPRFLLMNRDHAVLSFRFDTATGQFFDADEIIDASRAPLSVMSPRGTTASKEALTNWWRHRTIPRTRTGIEKKLAELGIAQTYDLPFRSMGLSLSDQYWIRPYESDLSWKDVNFYENPFVEAETQEWLADVGLDSPDNTSEGMLSKRWISREGAFLLLKGGTSFDQEPFNEAIASNLCSRILQPEDFVPYNVETWNDFWVSSCPCFVAPDEEYIPAVYVTEVLSREAHRNDHRHYLECCAALGVEDAETAVSKMIVIDAVMANTDRHWRNFGLIRNVETLEYRSAPIFDTGTSLWCTRSTQKLQYATADFAVKPFNEDVGRQLRMVDDVSWLDLDALSGFPEWACDLLDENPSMQGRVDFIFEGLQKNIERVERILG